MALPGPASVHVAACALRAAERGDGMVIEHNQVRAMLTDCKIAAQTLAEAPYPATPILADRCSHAGVTVPPRDHGEDAVQRMGTPIMRRVPMVEGRQPGGQWVARNAGGTESRRSTGRAARPP